MKPLFEKNKILIVDDIPQNIQLLGNILFKEGIDVTFATNGETALKIAHAKSIDLILLDIAMPNMDGYEVAKKLKSDSVTNKIPIIFLTAKIETDNVIKGFAAGAVDYVTKPFNTAKLLPRIFTHLELKKSRDIIEKQNKQLDEQNKQLKTLNATKDRILSIIGHDLRSPIGSISSALNLLTENIQDYTKDTLYNMMLELTKSAGSTYNLLENLLFWAKGQRGELSFNPEFIDINMIVEEIIELCTSTAKLKNINLYSTSKQPIEAFIDDIMITTTIRNLVTNAIKFTNINGKIKISITKKTNFIEVSIQDNGVGISKENITHLFNPESTHTTYGTGNEKGTGLGLILCKEFIVRHKGEIWVESEIGTGSTFKFTLPIESDEN